MTENDVIRMFVMVRPVMCCVCRVHGKPRSTILDHPPGQPTHIRTLQAMCGPSRDFSFKPGLRSVRRCVPLRTDTLRGMASCMYAVRGRVCLPRPRVSRGAG